MEDRYSLKSFFEFIRFIKEKNLVNSNTCRSWAVAGKKFEELIQSEEKAQDLRGLDFPSLIERFNHKNARKLKANSLNVYASRFKSAYEDFIRYTENPASYRPTLSQHTKNKVKISEKDKNKSPVRTDTVNSVSESSSSTVINHSVEQTILIPIPLRQGLTIQISGIPYDLTHREAEKISQIIKVYSTEDDNGSSKV